MNRITAIEQQKNDSGRVSVYVDGQYCLGCSAQVAQSLGLKVGDVMPPAQVSQLQQADDLAQAKRAAVRLLGHRARTAADLKKRLQNKDKFADHTIDETVAWLTEMGYLNDTKYADDRVQYLLRSNKMGRAGLEAKLVAEGVDRELARQTVSQTVSDEDEQLWARQLAQQRAERMRGKPWEAVKRSIWAHLNRRGFDSEHVWAAIQALEPEPDMQ